MKVFRSSGFGWVSVSESVSQWHICQWNQTVILWGNLLHICCLPTIPVLNMYSWPIWTRTAKITDLLFAPNYRCALLSWDHFHVNTTYCCGGIRRRAYALLLRMKGVLHVHPTCQSIWNKWIEIKLSFSSIDLNQFSTIYLYISFAIGSWISCQVLISQRRQARYFKHVLDIIEIHIPRMNKDVNLMVCY